MAWQRVDEHYTMKPGERFRLTWILQSPYPGSLMRGMIASGIKGVEKLKGMSVSEVNFVSPNETVYVPKNTTFGRYDPWEVNVVVSKGQPNFIEAGGPQDLYAVVGIIAAVLFGLGIVTILNRSAERFVDTLTGAPPPGSPPGTPSGPGLIPQVTKLSAVLIIGAVLVGAIVLMRG